MIVISWKRKTVYYMSGFFCRISKVQWSDVYIAYWVRNVVFFTTENKGLLHNLKFRSGKCNLMNFILKTVVIEPSHFARYGKENSGYCGWCKKIVIELWSTQIDLDAFYIVMKRVSCCELHQNNNWPLCVWVHNYARHISSDHPWFKGKIFIEGSKL